MEHRQKVLIVDDDTQYCLEIEGHLSGEYDVTSAPSWTEGRKSFLGGMFDVLLLDIELDERYDGLQALEEVRDMGFFAASVIVVSNYLDERAEERAMALGADLCIRKTRDPDRMKRHISAAIDVNVRKRQIELHEQYGREEFDESVRPVFRSQAMKRIRDRVRRFLDLPETILITGEPGTGKNVFAHWIHRESNRRHGPWQRIPLVGLSSTLFRSELTGHSKNAFTDAGSGKEGLLEMAHGGSVFFDEIGELGPDEQAQLLDLLEHKPFRRVRDHRLLTPDVRYICATNRRDLDRDVEQGKFRADLLSRMKICHIELPPLRDRREDIPLLAEMLLRRHATEYERQVTGIDGEVMDAMLEHAWPRNVRELSDWIRAGVINAEGPTIRMRDVEDLTEIPAEGRDLLTETDWLELPLKKATEEAQRVVIRHALRRSKGDRTAAAKLLEIPRESLYRHFNRLGLDPEEIMDRRGGSGEDDDKGRDSP